MVLGWVGKYSGDYLRGQQGQSGKRQQWAAEQFRSADLCLAGAASGARAHIIIVFLLRCKILGKQYMFILLSVWC